MKASTLQKNLEAASLIADDDKLIIVGVRTCPTCKKVGIKVREKGVRGSVYIHKGAWNRVTGDYNIVDYCSRG